MADLDMAGRENGARVPPVKVKCLSFLPQQWRKTKCKLCFHDVMDHTKQLTKQQSHNTTQHNTQELIRPTMNREETTGNLDAPTSDTNILQTKTETPDIIEQCYSTQSTYTTCSSKGSSDRLDDETEDAACSKFEMKAKDFPSEYGYDQRDSLDNEDDRNSPHTIKRRARSYQQFSAAMMRSSNSSLCSFTSEYTDGYSDYDYDIRSITDDTDDYDVIDELERLKPELKDRVQNERRVSRSKILDLEQELEDQQDHYRANEAAKDHQILGLQREIERLKLELSSVKAHEHILALKSRLELEEKMTVINDLHDQIRSLQDQVSSHPHDNLETQQDVLSRDLNCAHHKIARLEEDKTAFQEKISLIEDLHNNDKELLQFLHKQLESLDIDLYAEREKNRHLQDSVKLMEVTRSDYIKEQEKCGKLTKELENIRQKVKRRDRHIEDLEDDNVKLQQSKTELESQLSKRDFKIKKMERRRSELQNEVTKCNKEIADLTGEKKTFEQVRKLTDLKMKDLQGASPDAASSEVEIGKNMFIHTLEERLRHSESRAKELQLENDTLLKDIREYCENLNNAQKEVEEYKDLFEDSEAKNCKLREECTHMEKKNQWLQRKFHRSEQEKKRAMKCRSDKDLQLKKQHQEQQYMLNADTNPLNQEQIDENDVSMLKLKLQSTEAKLQMIEGNKSYLEKKVNSLERKVQDKDVEITRLHDSMERDSGVPSQDYDRSDVLETENVMLQSKLDELSMENREQKQLVSQLEENNTHLDATIKNLNEKLETCNDRLKELENANHSLGREAVRRSQSFTSGGKEDKSFNELRSRNKVLLEKVEKFSNLEEEVKQLNGRLNNEKGNVLWYSEENEKIKIKMTRLSQNIQSLENSKKEFERTIHQLQDTNKELDSEVKRLEEKLEIYGDLFGKDSNLSSSLKRRSYQSDDERDEERMFKNALAPLMEEIKEKDSQIRSLHHAMEDKNLQIESLTSELDRLHQSIAAQITEKIRSIPLSGDSSEENELSENDPPCPENLIWHKNDSCDEYYSPKGTIQRNNSNAVPSSHISPEINVKKENIYSNENIEVSRTTHKSNKDIMNTQQSCSGEELTVSTERFYEILREHRESMQLKDFEYYQNILGNTAETSMPTDKMYESGENSATGSESPSENKFYITIENALLDHYHQDGTPKTSLPSLTNIPNNDLGNNNDNAKNSDSKEIFSDDMYEELAELECMVNIKYRSPQISPSNTLTIAKISPCKEVNNKNEKNVENMGNSNRHGKMRARFNSATGKYDSEETKEVRHKVEDELIDEKELDLSGLDDLLAEVNKKESEPHKQVVHKKQKLQERKSLPVTSLTAAATTTVSTTKTIMPSIRTKMVRLVRSESLGSATGYRKRASVRLSVSSDSGLIGYSNRDSRTSSTISTGSQVSVIIDPDPDWRKSSESSTNSATSMELPTNGAPYCRPNINANKFLNSTFPNNDDSKR